MLANSFIEAALAYPSALRDISTGDGGAGVVGFD
jgi:hypothetical protein